VLDLDPAAANGSDTAGMPGSDGRAEPVGDAPADRDPRARDDGRAASVPGEPAAPGALVERAARLRGDISDEVAPSFRIALVQGGFGGDLDWDQAKAALSTYLRLSRIAARHKPDLIVWPESNAPYQPIETPGYLDVLRDLTRSAGSPLLLGAVAGTLETGLTNSAFLIGPEGPPRRYDKRRLVPYGEFVPFQRLFPFIRHFVAEVGEFRAGREAGVLTVAGRAIGVSICYEMIFPEEIREQARRGSTIAINLTNDSWYRRGGPWQHSDFSVLRAIESGLYAARAASTGRTLLIDPYGRTVGQGPLGGRAVLLGEIPAPERLPGRTLYGRFGDWAGIGCGILTAAMIAFLGVGNIIDRRRSARRVSLLTEGRTRR
jgi:apolipoprotein N-acyltransferase